MVAPRVDGLGAGVGQPLRNDLESDAAARSPVVRVEIPRGGVDLDRRHRPDGAHPEAEETETVETKGWSTSDAAYDRHERGLSRKGRWNGFTGEQGYGGAGATAASVTATLPTGRGYGPSAFQAPPQMPGEPAINYFMRFSAALHEYYRVNGARVGVGLYGFSPGTEPSSLLRPPRIRRRFALE